MAYSKNTWQSGDVVTSAKLNNIENGIANMNGMITMVAGDTPTLSVSYNEVLAMLDNGIVPFVFLYEDDGHGGAEGTIIPVTDLQIGESGYTVTFGGTESAARASDADAKLIPM